MDGAAADEAQWIASGLLDPAAQTAASRRALLAWLTSLGIPLDLMLEADREGDLAGLAGDLALLPGERFTVAELARRLEQPPGGGSAGRP